MPNKTWEPMIECVQKALASTQHVSPILTPDVRAFKLTEHEKQVLEAYEHLKARNWSKLNARSTQPESICEEYLACLQAKLGGDQDDALLRWALLLHDITKRDDVSEPQFGPHAETAAQVIEVLTFLDKVSGVSRKKVEWLVSHHDTLGNLYTGEQRPQELWEALRVGSSDEAIREPDRLGLLQAITFCDMWGTAGGKFLTNGKVDIWLNVRKRLGCYSEFVDYRISVWTGDALGQPNAQRKAVVTDALKSDEARDVFSTKIGRIAQGFYLFIKLAEIHPGFLSDFMHQVVNQWRKLGRPETINLQLDRYRDDGKRENCVLLARYIVSIDRNALKFRWNKEKKVLTVQPGDPFPKG